MKTGGEVRNLRLKRGLIQRQLGKMAGLHANSVKRLEHQAVIPGFSHARDRICEALGIEKPAPHRATIDKVGPTEFIRLLAAGVLPMPGHVHQNGSESPAEPRQAARAPRRQCGARTRVGRPCRAPARDNGRCRMHGGLSTGPKTAEGRERIRQAQLLRWARLRAASGSEAPAPALP